MDNTNSRKADYGNGSVSKDQAEIFQNKNPVNNKELQSNPSAAITGSKEDVENIELQIPYISVNDTFTVETSSYSLDDSDLNITDICNTFTSVLTISNEEQNSVQQENEVASCDVKPAAQTLTEGEHNEPSSRKPRLSVLLRFDPMYAAKSPNVSTIEEENCCSSDEEKNLHQINNEEIRESEAFFDATNNAGELIDIAQILPEEESCSGSNLEAQSILEFQLRQNEEAYRQEICQLKAEVKRHSEERENVKQHLADLEMSFSDLHQKYEHNKKMLITSQESVLKSEQKFELFKFDAEVQMEKSTEEIHKLNAIIKHLEIMNASIKDSLEQKVNECAALTALLHEVTGKV